MSNTSNGRDNLLAVYRHERPPRLPRNGDTAFMMFPGDWSMEPEQGFDWWGVHWTVIPLAGQMVTETGSHSITDLTTWREQMKIPDPYTACDWPEIAKVRSAHWNRDTQMGALIMLEGHFERMHSLMGFENALISFYDEDCQDAIRDLFSEITAYKFKCLDIAKKYFNPDVIVFHDDWGTDRNMFFNPLIWHEYIKPELKKVVDETHRLGMRFEMHSCGHIQETVESLVEEIGIDSIQTLQYPQNDIRMIKNNWGDRLVIRGGYDGQLIMSPGVTDEEIRASARESLRILAPGGNHIPYYYSFGQNPEHALAVFADAVDQYEKEFGPC